MSKENHEPEISQPLTIEEAKEILKNFGINTRATSTELGGCIHAIDAINRNLVSINPDQLKPIILALKLLINEKQSTIET